MVGTSNQSVPVAWPFPVGAPYYAGMAALRVGAELLYLCTAEEATGVNHREISGFPLGF